MIRISRITAITTFCLALALCSIAAFAQTLPPDPTPSPSVAPLPALPSAIAVSGYGHSSAGGSNLFLTILKDTGLSNGDHGHIYSYTKYVSYNFRQLIGKSSTTAQATDVQQGFWFPVYDKIIKKKYRSTFGVGAVAGATTTGQALGWNYGAKTGVHLSKTGSKFSFDASYEPTNSNITGYRPKDFSVGAGYDISGLFKRL